MVQAVPKPDYTFLLPSRGKDGSHHLIDTGRHPNGLIIKTGDKRTWKVLRSVERFAKASEVTFFVHWLEPVDLKEMRAWRQAQAMARREE